MAGGSAQTRSTTRSMPSSSIGCCRSSSRASARRLRSDQSGSDFGGARRERGWRSPRSAASEAELVGSAPLASKAASVTKVPILGQDVHDVSSLQLLARHLLPGAVL